MGCLIFGNIISTNMYATMYYFEVNFGSNSYYYFQFAHL